MKIVVITNGFVFVCKEFTKHTDHATLTSARCIRAWGTSNGLGELVKGPTPQTTLDDMIPIMEVPTQQIVFTFDVSEAWAQHL